MTIEIITRSDGMQQIGNCFVGKLDDIAIHQIRTYEQGKDAWGNVISMNDASVRADFILTQNAAFKMGKFHF